MTELENIINRGVLKNNEYHAQLQKILNRVDPFESNFSKDSENLFLIDNRGFVRVLAKTTPILEIFTKEKKVNDYIVRTAVGKYFLDPNFTLKNPMSRSLFNQSYSLLDEFEKLKSKDARRNWGKEINRKNDLFKLITYSKGAVVNGIKIDLDYVVDVILDILLFILGKIKEKGTIFLEYTDSIKYYLVTGYDVYPPNKFKIINDKLTQIA